MKRTATFLLALFLVLALSVTAFEASRWPQNGPEGHPNGGDQSLGGELEPVEDSSDDDDDQQTDTEESAEEESATEKEDAEKSSDATDESTEAATDESTEAGVKNGENAIGNDSDKADDAQNNAVNHTAIIVVIVCGSVLLILLIVIAVLLLKKKKPSDEDDEATDGGETPGIPVRIEVITGVCYNAELDFRLRRNLTIGTEHGCDLVFDDPAMQPLHAVISAAEDDIMLEECAGTGVTYIGGMKIFAPNRLRSGDLITIGDTSFRLYFE